MLQRCMFLVAAFFGVSAITIAQTQSVYVAVGQGSFYDFPIKLKDKPDDTDYVCASNNPAGPWTSALGRPCNFILWPNIPATQSIATCDTSSGACKNQNGGIESYVLKSSISGSTPTPPVVAPPTSGDGTATITWGASTVDTDKNPITATGYTLYYGTSVANLSTKLALPATPLTVTLSNLASGTYYFAMTATAGGIESDRTNLATKVVTASAPPVTPPTTPPTGPVVIATGGVWAAKSGSSNLKTGLATHDDCLAYLKTQAAGKYSCAFSGETVTVKPQ